MTGKYNISQKQGDTFNLNFTIRTKETGVGWNLTGYTARMQIRAKLDSDTVLHSLTTENGGILLDNVTKTITMYIPDETTQTFTFKAAVYDLELISGGEVTALASGSITLVREVTR